jgi:predicted nucleic acid-binding protein
MKNILIDTNILIRLFDASEPSQTEKAKRLFEEAKKGQVSLVIAPPVLFEVAWVLRSAMKKTNEEILDVLEAITSWPGLKTLDSDLAREAIALGRSRKQGFADAYLAATAQQHDLQIATFNENHFKKLSVLLFDL